MSAILDFLARNASAVETAWHILLIVGLAVVVRVVVHRSVSRLINKAVSGTVPVVLRPLRGRGNATVVDSAPLLNERRKQRTQTIGSVLRSVTSIVVFSVATTMVLSELSFDLAPIITSAGIVGVALGFGAQNLVKDFLNGMFMILEDQYGVGDAIDTGEASGIVEAVGLRVTRLRSVDGTVWHIRNGEIIRIGNMSQGWSRALLDISVAYETDTDLAATTIKRVADSVWKDPELGPLVLEEPEVWGVENLGIDGIAIRLVVKTAPLEQWKIARELRRRVKAAFAEAGIEIPFPQRSLWLRTDPAATPVVVPAGEAEPPVAPHTEV
ncbi:MAG: mechanosensitive ion channel family protein [Frankiales bacterium]|nr:mechanosensitive ion channel family protein [Frankiales bacterium]